MKNLLKVGFISTILLPLATLISCSNSANKLDNNNNWYDSNVTIQVNPGWAWDVNGPAFKNAAKILEKKVNELKNSEDYDKYTFKNLPDMKVSFDWSSSDNYVIVKNIENKKHDLGFASITATMRANQEKIQPLIQTKTKAFKFDLEWKVYNSSDTNNEDADLKNIAQETNTLFTSLYNDSNDSWDGAVYQNFYHDSEKVDFYRGVIWIYGNKKTQAKNAWNNKNWANFRDAGILHGGPKSGGRFQLQEKLLKKHFGEKAFSTLEEEMINHSSKFKKAYASQMKDDGFSVAFDDEGSFVWTKKTASTFVATAPEVLVATEPLKYDVGSFRNNFDPRQGKLIADAFNSLVKDAEDKSNSKEKAEALAKIYGPNYGYYDYVLINDRKSELEDKFVSVLGDL